jgi:hypothetical protein
MAGGRKCLTAYAVCKKPDSGGGRLLIVEAERMAERQELDRRDISLHSDDIILGYITSKLCAQRCCSSELLDRLARC